MRLLALQKGNSKAGPRALSVDRQWSHGKKLTGARQEKSKEGKIITWLSVKTTPIGMQL